MKFTSGLNLNHNLNLRLWFRLWFWPAGVFFLLTSPTFADESKVSIQHYLQGVLYEQQGNYAQALKEYESVVLLDPAASYVYKRQAELALELGDLEKALTAAEHAVSLEGASAQNYRLLGNVHWARGEVDKAREDFKKALEVDPHYEEALLSLANLTAPADPEAAKGYFQTYLEQNPGNAAEALYQMALIEERQGKLDAAAERLKQAVEKDPDALQARYALAQLYEVRQDTRAALGEYQLILDHEPGNASLWVRLGEIQALLGDTAAADAAFHKAKELQKDNPGASFWLAVRAEEKGDYAAAAEILRDSAHLASDPKLSLRLGYYLTQAGRLPDAVAVLETAFKKWPKNPEVGYFLGLGYDDLGQPAKAAPVLEAVATIEPTSRDARFQLAAVYEKLDRIEESIREFHVLLSSHPDDAQALNYLGYSLADRSRDLPEALGLIERAVALDPKNGAYLDSLGWAHFRLGRSTEALAELKASLAALNGDDAVWDHLGDVYQVLKDSDSAWTAWKQSLLLKPGQRSVADKLVKVEGDMGGGELGAKLLGFLQASEGGVRTLFGSCSITGKVAGREIALSALVHFERSTGGDVRPSGAAAGTRSYAEGADAAAGGTIRIEVLGPLFMPMWRAYLGSDDRFEMDPLEVQGAAPGSVDEVVSGSLRVLRDHWDGRLFDGPGTFRKGWSKKWIETPTHLLFLSANHLYLQNSETRAPGVTVKYKNFQTLRGHPLPKVYDIEGRGWAVRIQLDQLGAEFIDTPAKIP